MDMPKPNAAHRRLKQLAGEWKGDETIHPSPLDPKGGKARAFYSASMALGDFHLIADYREERDGIGNFEGHGVYGWDERGKCYTMHWFDSMGFEHGAPALGTWEGNTLTLQHETTHLGLSRYVYEVAENELRLLIQNSPDGREWKTFLEGIYRRV